MNIVVHKSIPSPDRTQDLMILAREEIPHFTTLEEVSQFADGEAQAIEKGLYATLPGATYDRLLGRMLARKSTHFIVSHHA